MKEGETKTTVILVKAEVSAKMIDGEVEPQNLVLEIQQDKGKVRSAEFDGSDIKTIQKFFDFFTGQD